MTSHIKICCVPTEAGTHFAGQSKAPQAVLDVGLAERLSALGFKVSVHHLIDTTELEDLAAWKPSPKEAGVRNEEATIKIMDTVRAKLSALIHSDDFAIVIGGDCTITPAVLSACWQDTRTRFGILYFDGDADLTLPSQTTAEGSSGILDSMTLSHLTLRDGCLPSMKRFCRPDGSPLVTSDNIVLFGFDPLQPTTEHWVYLLENQFKAISRPTVEVQAKASAEEALQWLSERCDKVYLHFDVDAIDCGDFPLANYPHYAGISHSKALEALVTILESPIVRGLIITEINANNDPKRVMIKQVIDAVLSGMKIKAPTQSQP